MTTSDEELITAAREYRAFRSQLWALIGKWSDTEVPDCSGAVDVASYQQGVRDAYEGAVSDLRRVLGVDPPDRRPSMEDKQINAVSRRWDAHPELFQGMTAIPDYELAWHAVRALNELRGRESGAAASGTIGAGRVVDIATEER
jgi:hypothetical protein